MADLTTTSASSSKSDVFSTVNLKISIVTVVRNGIRFIEQTMESVLRQTYPQIEYIVIDGGSTDGTVDVIRAYGDKVAYWISEPDRGIADAFNKGLARATGDYLLFLNADDALADGEVVARVVQLVKENALPEILYGNCDLLDRESEQVLSHTDIEFTPEKMRYGHMIPQPSMFTRRTYFEKYGHFDTAFRIAMDFEWLLRGALKERVVHVPTLVTRVHDGGISTQSRAAVIDEIFRALKKNAWIHSWLGECKFRTYFGVRLVAKTLFKIIGFYKKHK